MPHRLIQSGTTAADVIVPLEFKDNTGKVYVYNFSSDGDFSINNE